MASRSTNEGLMDRLRQIEIHPMFLAALGILVVLSAGYFGWFRPKMEAEKAMRDFNTPEAQAKRDPDQRKVSPTLQSKIDELRAKETHLNAGSFRRRRDE